MAFGHRFSPRDHGDYLAGMTRWSRRFRRAASLVLGVHLLQVILLAASAVCDLSAGAVSAQPPVASAAQTAPANHGVHHVTHDMAPTSDTPADHGSHHETHTTNCPMAMACAASAVLVPVEQLATNEVRVVANRIAHKTEVLRSLQHAPEPPPPRV